MFEYAVEALHMSESEAYTRIRAARLSRDFPAVLAMIASGELHLSAIKLLAPVLTAENCAELLAAARFKSKRQVESMLAQRLPRPDVPNVIRKLPAKASDQQQPTLVVTAKSLSATPSPETISPQTGHAPTIDRRPAPALHLSPPSTQPSVGPLSPGRYKIQFTACQRLHDKLEQARDLMRHQTPDGDLATILERALDLLIAERMKQHFAKVRTPRARAHARPAAPACRHIPHAVRREVLSRDGHQCTYRSPHGKRCQQRGGLEFHHEQPFGRGGAATTDNIRMLCRAHNQLLAQRDYGRAFMQQHIAPSNSSTSTPSLVPEHPERAINVDPFCGPCLVRPGA
jgi:5-methylcytosine-specific restriction endonuclease McrA